jgi:hypothetical protein
MKRNKKFSKIYRTIRARKYGKFHSFYKKGEFIEVNGKLVYLQ